MKTTLLLVQKTQMFAVYDVCSEKLTVTEETQPDHWGIIKTDFAEENNLGKNPTTIIFLRFDMKR